MTSPRMTSHKHRSPLPWFVCALLVLLLLTACSAEQGLSSPSPTVRPQPTQQPSPGPSPVVQRPTQQTAPGPAPVATLLAPAPRDCPSGPSLGSKVFPQFSAAPLTGNGAVWESGLPANATLNLNQLGYTPWPVTKILWPIGPNFPDLVVVRVTNLRTGSEARWAGKEALHRRSLSVRSCWIGQAIAQAFPPGAQGSTFLKPGAMR